MADSLRSTTPVPAAGGFLGRQSEPRSRPRHAPEAGAAAPASNAERVDPRDAAVIARRLLRERVLARTRHRLRLDAAATAPEFAEDIDTEPVAAFVGRLLSAQNLLSARRVPGGHLPALRPTLDLAMREGAAEAAELLAASQSDGTGVVLIAEVLAEYERRLATLLV